MMNLLEDYISRELWRWKAFSESWKEGVALPWIPIYIHIKV
jgi:hypothetical protein